MALEVTSRSVGINVLNLVVHFGVKILFSGALGLVIGLCAGELWRIWFDRRPKLGTFVYIKDGEIVKEQGAAFARLVSHDLRLVGELHQYYFQKIKPESAGSPATCAGAISRSS